MKRILILFFALFLVVACSTETKKNSAADADTKTEKPVEVLLEVQSKTKDVKKGEPVQGTEARLISFFKAKYVTMLPVSTEVELGNFRKSAVKGMNKGSFKVLMPGREEQTVPFLIGEDGKYIIFGVMEATNFDDFEESEIAGFKKGTINFGRQLLPVLLSDDSSQLIVGEVLDSTVDPLQEVISKIALVDVPLKGSEDAKVTVVEYSDFQCSFCKRASDMLPLLMEEYDGKIKVIFKQFPLPNHDWAKPASIASLCAYEQGNDKFWKFHDLIFANQREITLANSNEKFKKFATQTGLSEDEFDKCLISEATAAKVDAEINEARQIGVNSTPTFIIDGLVVTGVDATRVRNAIDSRL